MDDFRLDIVKQGSGYLIYEGDHPLKTPGGNDYFHPDSRLLVHVLTDFMCEEGVSGIRPHQIFQFRCDTLDHADPVLRNMEKILSADPFVRVKRGIRESRNEDRSSTRLADSLIQAQITFSFLVFSELLREVNRIFEENIRHHELPAGERNPFEWLLRKIYSISSPEQRSCVNLLIREHEPGLVLPLLLVYGRITPSEYARGALSQRLRQVVDEVAPGSFCFVVSGSVCRDAGVVRDYLEIVALPASSEVRLAELIRMGEGSGVEFKSTLRWDLRQGKTSQQIERAALKTINAFLNSEGGSLVIGIRDDGSVEGIESDRLPNEDKWLLHLWALIRTCFGKDVTPYIRTTLEKTGERTVCLVHVSGSPRPVFLRQPGFEEEFYIRVGPGSASMSVSEALKYIADHFPGR